MGPIAFLRLFWRPAMIPAALTLCMLVLLFAVLRWTVSTAVEGTPAGGPLTGSPAGMADFVALALPFALGLFAGDVGRDLRRRSFAFLLPDLDLRMLFGTALLGLFAALISAWTHAAISGARPALLVGAFGLFWYAYGAAVTDRPLPRFARVAAWLLALAAVVRVEELLDVVATHSAFATLFASLAAAALIAGMHARAIGRALSGVPAYISILDVFQPSEQERYRAEKLARRREAVLRLPPSPLGDDVWAWTRVLRVQGTGFLGRNELWIHGIGWPLLAVTIGAAISFQDGLEVDGSIATGTLYALHTLLRPDEPPPFENVPPYAQVTTVAANWAWILANASLGNLFRLGWTYPLSRLQRARIALRSMRLDLLAFAASLAACFTAVTLALAWIHGGVPSFTGPPAYLRDLGLVAVLLPLAQWVHVRWLAEPGAETPALGGMRWLVALVGFVGIAAAARALAGPWLELLTWPWQAAFFIAALAASQTLLRQGVVRHFARADLG